MEVCLPTALSRHFSLRLKQCLLFLQATNDLEILQLLLAFLPLKDLLHFLAVSTHFASFKRLQSVEIRILRAKLAHLQKPEEPLAWNPYQHLLPLKPATPQSKTQKINDGKNDFPKMIRKLRLIIDPKRNSKGKTSQQKMPPRTDNQEFSKFSQELNTEGRQLEQKLKGPSEGWADVSQAMQNDFILNQLKHVNNHSEKILPESKKPINPHSYPKSSPTSPLDLLEHHHARIDYERRKARRMLQKEVFISVEQFRQLAQQDACSRQVFNNVYEEEKIRQQQMNVAKLRMPPTPDPKQFQLQAVEVKVKKQSIAGKVFSGIKELLEMEGRF